MPAGAALIDPAPTPLPTRNDLLARLGDERFDVLGIGGGGAGLGCALDAASRGLRTALVEAADFAQATSRRSTKLIHGGVRYLAQGNVKLVREALAERALLLANAPALVHPMEFIVPCYRLLEREIMRVGLGLYDGLAGVRSIGPTRTAPDSADGNEKSLASPLSRSRRGARRAHRGCPRVR